MKPIALIACLACLLPTGIAHGQSITTEVAVTAGYSTDDVKAVAAQLRAFGDVEGGVRFFGEAAWARSSNDDDDVFAAAYPYGNRIEIVEAYAERMFRPNDAIVGVRAGRFRPPFGIYNASDHAYSGFLRPPLIRYDDHSAISNTFLEHGADLVVGTPQLTVETALGAPGDVGAAVRRSGFDAIVHVQGYYGPLIAGASYIRTSPLQSAAVDHGRASMTGIDLRWTYAGVQVRGEWVRGQPSEGSTTSGWYADTLIHLARMGPVTAVARLEQLDYQEPGLAEEQVFRQTIGARIRLVDAFSLHLNLVHRGGELEEYKPNSVDVGLTWSARRHP
jgi:hypothetical protein